METKKLKGEDPKYKPLFVPEHCVFLHDRRRYVGDDLYACAKGDECPELDIKKGDALIPGGGSTASFCINFKTTRPLNRLRSCSKNLVEVTPDPDAILAPQHGLDLFSEDYLPKDIINYIFSFFDRAVCFQSNYLGILAGVCKRFYVTSYNFKGNVGAQNYDVYNFGLGTYFPPLNFIRRYISSPSKDAVDLCTRCSYTLDEGVFGGLFYITYIDNEKKLKKPGYLVNAYEKKGADGIPVFLDAIFFGKTPELDIAKKIKSFSNICTVKRFREQFVTSPNLSTFFVESIKTNPGGDNFTRIFVKHASDIPRDFALDYLKCAIDAWSEEDVIVLFNTKRFDFTRDKIGDAVILDYVISLFTPDAKPLNKLMNHLCPLMSETQLETYFKRAGVRGARRLFEVGSIIPTFNMFLEEARKSKSAALLWEHIPTTEKMRICPTWKPPPEVPKGKRGRKKKE